MASAATRIDGETYRQIMGEFPAGVAIVTAVGPDGRPRGLTTTAVTSVSLDPPLLLVCVGLESRTLPAIRHSGGFAVNFVRAADASVALRFASKAEDKFTEASWSPGESGHPVLLEHCVAWAECRVVQETEVGDHIVFVGEVTHGGTSAEARTPLMYLRRGFGRWETLDA